MSRLGLRYINKLDPGEDFLHGLQVSVTWPQPPNGVMRSVNSKAVFTFNEPHGELGVVVGAKNKEDQTILDLDFATKESVSAQSVDAVLEWTRQAHDKIYETFRAFVSPDLYSQWEGEPDA